MDIQTRTEPVVRVAHDEMEAYLTLPTLGMEDSYSKEHILSAIEKAGVCYGIDESLIDAMISERRYGREFCIARGKEMIPGIDGKFDYHFNLDFNNRPKIREDGTVDYWSIHTVELVTEGQLLAEYTEPTMGEDGKTVRGRIILAKRGKALPPLVGKGFECSEDGNTYTSSMAGKIEMQGNRMQILPVYELFSDVDLSIGNINFRGDVIVHGNVAPGAVINATGNVTIDGICEACTIIAGKDILLRGGILGGGRGKIKCKGNLVAKFFEYANVEVEGFIEANSFLNSTVVCYERIYVSGKHSSVVGGSVYGAMGIEVDNLGNISEVTTEIAVGVHRTIADKTFMLSHELEEVEGMIQKINVGIEQLDEYGREKNISMIEDERRVSLLRARILKQTEATTIRNELNKMLGVNERALGSTVRVINRVYPGVVITVDGQPKTVKEEQKSVEFAIRGSNLVMFSLDGEVVE